MLVPHTSNEKTATSILSFKALPEKRVKSVDARCLQWNLRSFLLTLLCFPLLLTKFNSHAVGKRRATMCFAMKPDFADYAVLIVIILCSLAILAFAVGYVWSVVNRHYTTRCLEKNNEVWLNYLLSDRYDSLMNAMRNHPDDFLLWLVGLPDGDYEERVSRLT